MTAFVPRFQRSIVTCAVVPPSYRLPFVVSLYSSLPLSLAVVLCYAPLNHIVLHHTTRYHQFHSIQPHVV